MRFASAIVMKTRNRVRLFSLVLFGLPMLVCSATTYGYCIDPKDTDPAHSLSAALNDWVQSGADTDIRLMVGTHHTNINVGSTSGTLTIKGGYKDTNCFETNRSKDASLTVLDGGGGPNSTFIVYFSQPTIISDLTFQNYTADLAGVQIVGNPSANGTLTVDHVIGIGNSLVEFLGGSDTVVKNVLVYGQPAVPTPTLAALRIDSYAGVTATGLTVVDNAGPGLDIYSAFDTNISVFNSIVEYNQQGNNFVTNGNSTNPPAISHILTTNAADCVKCSETSVYEQDAGFNANHATNHDYHLLSTSYAIDRGTNKVANNIGLSATDIGGHSRVQNSIVDLGAYESTAGAVFSPLVTDQMDTGQVNQLRWAINQANMYSLGHNNSPVTIKFSISGDCPHLTNLFSPLPDITGDVTIDGNTQPQPVMTEQPCIQLRGSASSPHIDHALKTGGTGRLTVQGIEFEGFKTAAIDLASGSGHIVVGNGFSAFADAFDGFFSNAVGVLIEGTATAGQIGYADEPNVFAETAGPAIKLLNNGNGNHNIQGNYFGFNFDGTPYVGAQNKFGILVTNSAGNHIEGNYIGGSQVNAISLTGANTANNVVSDNHIGIAPTGGSPAGNGVGICNPVCFGAFPSIDLSAGAHDNVVGAQCSSSSTHPNLITHNFGPGVSVESNAGTGNQICGVNFIYNNSGHLAIDLGLPGPTANDNGDIDNGGNNVQNYPVLSKATRIEANVMRFSGNLPTPGTSSSYRFDFFWSDTCVPGNPDTTGPRGELKLNAGSLNVVGSLFSNADLIAYEDIPKIGFLSAIATDASGNTSEPGPCFPLDDDYIFSDSLGH